MLKTLSMHACAVTLKYLALQRFLLSIATFETLRSSNNVSMVGTLSNSLLIEKLIIAETVKDFARLCGPQRYLDVFITTDPHPEPFESMIQPHNNNLNLF
jgi:hypothetical protein